MVFSLSVHADYRCRHSGACCTAGWSIPVEAPKQTALGAAVLTPDRDGVCRFFDASTHLCVVHRDNGEAALPDTCRHFPRVALVDGRGTHVTLSHFCPTAAALLFRDDAGLAIVESPAAFPASRDYDGLDARGEWPPMVHRTLLFDHTAYSRWEQFVVSALARETTASALPRIATLAERLRRWTPAEGPLADALDRYARAGEFDGGALDRYAPLRADAQRIVLETVPDALKRSAAAPAGFDGGRTNADVPGARPAAAVARYLAAKAFASWTAYQGHGVRTLVAELVLADGLVTSLASSRPLLEAIREADRLLVHLADRQQLVAHLGQVEDTR